jgi:RNA polymerase sigma-70 factor (ECF subfamily)
MHEILTNLKVFEEYISRHQDQFVRQAFYRTGNIHDAEDVVQDVLTKLYLKRAKMSNVGSITPYVYRMIINACIDLMRKQKGTEFVGDFSGVEQQSCSAVQPDALDEQRRIEKLLAQLPEEQATIVRYRIFDKLRFDEISRVIDCPVATVKSRFRYGIEKLRKIVTPLQEAV